MQTLVVSKTIVVNSNGEILLLRRSDTDDRRPNEWDIPGGHTDEGEYPVEAAARETMEEAGIAVDPRDLVLVYAMTEVPRDELSVTWVFYRISVDEHAVRLSHEHSEYAWVSLEEALTKITYERQKRALQYVKDNSLLTATAA
jgi:dATP pyrophosphohydrolase